MNILDKIRSGEIPPSPQLLSFIKENFPREEYERLKAQWKIVDTASTYLDKFITQDPFMLEMKKMVFRLSVVPDCILIQGETGTGKELIAQALHGSRKGKFVAINCAGMPENLIESELFGYEAGAYTGAAKTTDGLIAHAEGGTLFLDEIGDLPLGMQAKLLRVIQERTVRKVGGKNETAIDVKFVAATHCNLAEQVQAKLFRQDLFARLAVFKIEISPLRSRLQDIPLIIASLDPHDTFPQDKVDWSKVDLSWNVRHIQSYIRQWTVLNKLPY